MWLHETTTLKYHYFQRVYVLLLSVSVLKWSNLNSTDIRGVLLSFGPYHTYRNWRDSNIMYSYSTIIIALFLSQLLGVSAIYSYSFFIIHIAKILAIVLWPAACLTSPLYLCLLVNKYILGFRYILFFVFSKIPSDWLRST